VSSVRLPLAVGIVLLVAVTRDVLEATMQRHMLVQLPVLFAAGVVFAQSLASRDQRDSWEPRTRSWNVHGIAGLVLATGVVMTWMVPRALDAAVESVGVDGLKVLSLVLAGTVSWYSWRAAPAMVRTFVVGNVAWMTATVGMLLLDAPTRLCANYGASDQRVTGIAMIILTVAAIAATTIRALFFPVSRTAPQANG
jgi:hypothetical protein